ncbi:MULTISPECIES: hypothetical protein [Bradyrhizobium]|uniref:hypothetical protein n=1 Tax=Bradyrhizobium TaxID=374 RepID=UPI00115FEDD7|nr:MULTISPECIES: hypothetical protein [Bradyrhizobium]
MPVSPGPKGTRTPPSGGDEENKKNEIWFQGGMKIFFDSARRQGYQNRKSGLQTGGAATDELQAKRTEHIARQAFDMASKPASSSSTEFALIAKMAASVDTLDGFIREMKIRFPDATARAMLPPEARGGQERARPHRLVARDRRHQAGRGVKVGRRPAAWRVCALEQTT